MLTRARTTMTLLLATAVAVLLTVALPAVSAQAYTVGNYYKLVSFSTPGDCMDIATYESLIIPHFCAQGSDEQKWLLESTSDSGYYRFHNKRFGGCITYQSNGAFDDLCSSGDSRQRFAIQSTSQPGYYKLVVQSNGQCMTYVSAGYVGMRACAQGDGTQYWKLQSAS
jgi:Ricin-type beta-trefoil lectin domain-like